jgi:serine/threonine-protein kinase
VEHLGQGLLEKGTRLGEYEIERVLGVGSMGAVYEGVCTATGHRHAIKVLRPALASLPVARDRFLNEAKLTARIRHPHIVDVTDVGNDAGRVYFVMELLNGEDLARRLQRSGTLPAAEIADIMLPVCDAVAEAHRRGVTHRDLKPSNIFLLVRGRRPFPVVLDFGIAKDEQSSAPSAGGSTGSGKTLFGTPYYLAPEVVADHQAAGPASDQYALGVILYECLTGAPPYRGDTVDAIFRASAEGKAVLPSTRRAGIPPELDAVVMRALNPDPKARFFSVAELRQALVPFSSKGTGPTPVLQPHVVASLVAQSSSPLPVEAPTAVSSPPIEVKAPWPVEAARDAQKRELSSPAIEVEAATRSPFVRTLTPEVEALDNAWFAAGDALHQAAPAPIPSFVYVDGTSDGASDGASDGMSDSGASQTAEPSEPAAYEAVPKPSWNLGSRWVRVGALAGGALSVLVAVLVVTRGHAPAHERPALPAAALVQVEPSAAKPARDNVALAPAAPAPSAEPAPSESPSVVAAPAPALAAAPSAPPPPVEAPAAPAPKNEAPIAAAPPAPEPVPPPRAAPPAPPPPPEEAPASAAPEPPHREAPARAPRERVAAAPKVAVAPVAAPPRPRKSVEKPRPPAPAAVRMHNGVPLLD